MDRGTPLLLTQRDIGIVTMVHAYGGCTVDHIRRRFFTTPGARSACYARIAVLVEDGYLTSLRLPSQSGQGSGKAFLRVGPSGRRLLAKGLGLSRSDLNRASRTASPLFIGHHLALCDLRVSLELAADSSSVFRLIEWIGDSDLKRTPLRITDPKTQQIIPIVPDARFSLGLADGSEQAFLVEMDMGTVAPKRMKAKLRAYLSRSIESACPVLFIVPNQVRQKSLAQWAHEAAQEFAVDSTIVWLARQEAVTEHSFLACPIWQVVGGPEDLALSSLVAGSTQIGGSLSFGGVSRGPHSSPLPSGQFLAS